MCLAKRVLKIARLVSETSDFESPENLQMAAILGKFGVHRRIQQCSKSKPNMQLLIFYYKAHLWSNVTVSSDQAWLGDFSLENQTNSSSTRLPCKPNFATVEFVIWFQLLSRHHFIGYDWRGNTNTILGHAAELKHKIRLQFHFQGNQVTGST
jgi:hypothetical protein